MGKTARWFRGLWAGKKTEVSTDSKPPKEKEKWRWGIVRWSRDKDHPARSHGARNGSYREGSSASYGDAAIDQDKHAKAVAAATAAVAEAAVAAAQAAAAVVKLTSSGRCDSAYISEKQEECAAVKIQSAFRGYLARRALKALKGLVKLQALVRGHMVRKQMAADLRWLQALVRVQARARAACGHVCERRHPGKAIHLHPGPETPEKHERPRHTTTIKCENPPTLKRNITKPNGIDINNVYKAHMGRNWLDQWMDEKSWDHQEAPAKAGITDDEKNDKILEIDPGKPHFNPKRRSSNVHSPHSSNLNSQSHASLPDSPSKDSTTAQLSISSPSSVEMQSLSPLRFPLEVDDFAFCTEDNSPKFFSASLRPGNTKSGPFTPTKSDCSQSFLSGYSDYPNYMTNTESSRAKVRSQSAPKQRLEFEKSSSTKRFSVHGLGDARANTGVPKLSQRSSSLHAKFTSSKAYPGTGRLDGLGMSVREAMGCNGTYRNRY